jgi:spore germination cell wall hydrolase CwlJ-like protein
VPCYVVIVNKNNTNEVDMSKIKTMTKVKIAATIFMAQAIAVVGVASNAESFDTEMSKVFGGVANYTVNAQETVDVAQQFCLAQNIYFEAREYWSTNIQAMEAVGHVTMNRAASNDFPDTVCNVVYQGPLDGSAMTRHRCQFSWFCDGKSDRVPVNDNIIESRAWNVAQAVASRVIRNQVEDQTHGSTYYHASYVTPNWSTVYDRTTTIGKHHFYTH